MLVSWHLETLLQFSKFAVNGSSLCDILWSRRSGSPCVLSRLVNHLIFELGVNGLGKAITHGRLGIVQSSLSSAYLIDKRRKDK